MPWTWDAGKDRANQRKHKLSFELAQRVFDDPFAASRPDPCPDEERWQTMPIPFDPAKWRKSLSNQHRTAEELRPRVWGLSHWYIGGFAAAAGSKGIGMLADDWHDRRGRGYRDAHRTGSRPPTGEETGRIISARKATTHERKTYEEGKF